MTVSVASAAESAAADASAIALGIPSRALMRVAASNAATVIASRYAANCAEGVVVFTGPGNNGGDGWCVARALAAAGVRVSVREAVDAKSTDAIAERGAARASVGVYDGHGCGVVIDALLGTGSTGAPRGPIADAVREMLALRANGAVIVALDVPTGLDATTGDHDGNARADLTISFGSAKRGLLAARGVCGEIVVLDIGLPRERSGLPMLVDDAYVRAHVPAIAATANKGTRRKLAIVAGGPGMGGAAILAAEGALRSGIGLVKVITDDANIGSIHARLPEALTGTLANTRDAIIDWADAVLIGPGLGHGDNTRQLVVDVLTQWRGPVVVDADALNVFSGDLVSLGALLGKRPAVITPHPVEFGRLVGHAVEDVLAGRFDIGADVARTLGAAVLLKGTPTVVSGPDGARYVVATGTPALATGGSGDALGGMIATLLAQRCDSAVAATCAAWVHGRAAELTPGIRGFTLLDVLERLEEAWQLDSVPCLSYPVLAGLPAVV